MLQQQMIMSGQLQGVSPEVLAAFMAMQQGGAQ